MREGGGWHGGDGHGGVGQPRGGALRRAGVHGGREPRGVYCAVLPRHDLAEAGPQDERQGDEEAGGGPGAGGEGDKHAEGEQTED